MSTQHTTKQRLGILLCGHSVESMAEIYGQYDQAFTRLLGPDRYDYRVFPIVENVFPDSVEDADAWLVTGSVHGVYEDWPWIAPLEQLIRDIYAKQLPMVGVCFGHQIMAQALGGKVEKFSGGWVAGTQQYSFAPDTGIAVNDPDKVVINAWHQDQVVEKPANARVIGSSADCKIAALEYGKNTVSMQPHPEFDNEYLGSLLEFRGDTLPEPVKQVADSSFGQTLTSPRIADWLNEKLSSA